MTESDKALDKQIETLRALLGQESDSKLGLSKPKPPLEEKVEPSLHSNDDDVDLSDISAEKNTKTTDQVKSLPTATKTFTTRDFLHFKKHSNEQSLVLIKRFLSKHGKPEENSSELQALTNAISRIISKSSEKEPEK